MSPARFLVLCGILVMTGAAGTAGALLAASARVDPAPAKRRALRFTLTLVWGMVLVVAVVAVVAALGLR